ncbi:DUF2314 domain-containing protein [Pseudoalteromonas sp. SSDWG2]|uniref:DUF2314 domain-containing protein n=1 Tax=Pseudoalteromonas sp. SSDWG2 TaxID=3139391 RepID=UPI003BA9D60A
MLRIIVIALFSFCAFVPIFIILTQLESFDNSTAGVVAFGIAWLVLPFILLKLWRTPIDFKVLNVDKDDPVMHAQICRARAELDRFIAGLKEGKREAYVKFPYAFDNHVEHVWGVAHCAMEEGVTVSLACEPIGELNDELSQRIYVRFTDIEDWMLQDANGYTQGGYTMLAMARIYERDHGRLPSKYARDLEPFVDFPWPEERA